MSLPMRVSLAVKLAVFAFVLVCMGALYLLAHVAVWMGGPAPLMALPVLLLLAICVYA